MQQQIINLSEKIWRNLLNADTEAASPLMDEAAVFVHMGATFDKAQELEAIRNRIITLKTLDVEEQSVRFVADTAVLLKKIRLTAVVKGEEVTNPFVVTEVYVRPQQNWLLVAMSYTRIVY